jgi:hypothetical protein
MWRFLITTIYILLISIRVQILLWTGEKEGIIPNHFGIVTIALILIAQAGLIGSVLNILLV